MSKAEILKEKNDKVSNRMFFFLIDRVMSAGSHRLDGDAFTPRV